jgi:hypothetical protein
LYATSAASHVASLVNRPLVDSLIDPAAAMQSIAANTKIPACRTNASNHCSAPSTQATTASSNTPNGLLCTCAVNSRCIRSA